VDWLIKVGDKYINRHNEEMTITKITPYVVETKGKGVEINSSYSSVLYDLASYQKQRADECHKVIDNLGRCVKLQEEKIYQLEKRWSDLKDFLNEIAMLADEKFQIVNNAALLSEAITCERIVEKMHVLEEDGDVIDKN